MTVYGTAEQLKAQPGITGGEDDSTIDLMLSAASAAIDGYCGRPLDGFLASELASSRLYAGKGLPYLWIDEAVEVSKLEVKLNKSADWLELDVSEYLGFQGNPDDPNFNRFPYRGLMLTGSRLFVLLGDTDPGFIPINGINPNTTQRVLPSVRVTGRWGYADLTPPQVVQATITQAARWFKRGQSFWADTAADSAMGTLSYRQSLDPDIEMMLKLSRLIRPIYAS